MSNDTRIDADRLRTLWLRTQAAYDADYDERYAAADRAAPAPAPATRTDDISDDDFLIAIAAGIARSGIWTTFFELEVAFGGTSWDVLRAKLREADGRDLVTGCDCGCRGDIELLDLGLARLREIAAALAAAGVRLPGAMLELDQ